MKKCKCIIAAAVAVAMLGTMVGCGSSDKANDSSAVTAEGSIDWSEIVLKDVIPEPPTLKGEIMDNSDEKLWIELEDVTDK